MSAPDEAKKVRLVWYPAQPRVEKGVPHCAQEGCREFDGERCGLIGFRPGALCEPAIVAMADVLKKLDIHPEAP